MVSGSSIKSRLNGTLKNDFSDVTYSSGKSGFSSGLADGTDSPVYFDWFLVRKYVATEPSHSTWGSEESAPTPPAEESAVGNQVMMGFNF